MKTFFQKKKKKNNTRLHKHTITQIQRENIYNKYT